VCHKNEIFDVLHFDGLFHSMQVRVRVCDHRDKTVTVLVVVAAERMHSHGQCRLKYLDS
jgi:hypothetical protein